MTLALQGSQHALLESPTGTGKSMALLCGALGWLDHEKSIVSWKNSDHAVKVQAIVKKIKTIEVEYESHRKGENDLQTLDRLEQSINECYGQLVEEESLTSPTIYFGSRTHKQIKQAVKE